MKKDPSFASKVKRIVILGGAFFAQGNVNPAAEANVIPKFYYACVFFSEFGDDVKSRPRKQVV